MAEHKISDEVMANTELLAKLALTDEEREKSRQEMEKILGYVDKLNELDTEGVEPLISSFSRGKCVPRGQSGKRRHER